MKTSNHFGYSTKIWLTSAFVAPIFIGLYFGITEELISGLLVIPLAIGIGLLLSIPNWLLLTLSVWMINKSNLIIEEKKSIITAIAFFLTVGLFFIVLGGDEEIWIISIPYMGILVFGIWFYKLIPPYSKLGQKPISKKIKVLEEILDDENY